MNEEILMQAMTNTIYKIKEEGDASADLIVMTTLILSVYLKELNLLLKEENKDDNSSKN